MKMRVIGLVMMHLVSALASYGQNNPFTKIATANKLKQKAAILVDSSNYQDAASIYATLIDEYKLQEDALYIDRAHLLYLAGKTTEAQEAYRQASINIQDKRIKSTAFNQLGYLAAQNTDEPESGLKEALALFKEALKADYTNQKARRNYEITYRKVYPRADEQQEQPNDNQQQENQDDQQQEKQEPIEPSDYAKQQKALADGMIGQGNYARAYDIMQEALAKDNTVQAYNDYIKRLGDIAEISE
jgi:hypothetical protein